MAAMIDSAKSLTIMTYNVCNPVEVQKNPDLFARYSWSGRKERIFSVILRESPDVICLQEIRNEPGKSSVADLWEGLGTKGYEFVSYRNNPSDASLINVIGYKTARVAFDTFHRFWASETPDRFSDSWGNGWGRVTLLAKFYPIAVTSKGVPTPDYSADPLFVGNLHHGLKHEERKHSNEVVIAKVHELVTKGHVFMCGDFNCFPDDGGAEELALWDAAGFTRLTTPFLRNQDGVSISGTWRGYPYDKFCSADHSFGAQLDNIFFKSVGEVSGHYACDAHINTLRCIEGKEEIAASTEAEVVTGEDGAPFRDFPSDHMAVIVKATLI